MSGLRIEPFAFSALLCTMEADGLSVCRVEMTPATWEHLIRRCRADQATREPPSFGGVPVRVEPTQEKGSVTIVLQHGPSVESRHGVILHHHDREHW